MTRRDHEESRIHLLLFNKIDHTDGELVVLFTARALVGMKST